MADRIVNSTADDVVEEFALFLALLKLLTKPFSTKYINPRIQNRPGLVPFL